MKIGCPSVLLISATSFSFLSRIIKRPFDSLENDNIDSAVDKSDKTKSPEPTSVIL